MQIVCQADKPTGGSLQKWPFPFFLSVGILILLCLYYGTMRMSAETTGTSQKQSAQMKDV